MTSIQNPQSKIQNLPLLWPLLALAALVAINARVPGFLHLAVRDGRVYGTTIDILDRAAPTMIVSLGMTLVIATAGVDLSIGATMAIAGAAAATLIARGGSVVPAIAAALAVGAIAGLCNGALVAFVRVQPIVATLILMVAGRGVAQLITDGQIVTFDNRAFEFLGGGAFLGLPFPITIAVASLAIIALFTRRTAAGLFIEAVGDNPVASRYAGVNERLVKLIVYVASGLCAAVAGCIVTADNRAADANNTGLYLELDAILAVVIGGTSLAGGRFSLLGSIVGALVIQTLTTMILTRGVAVELTLIVKGAVVIGVCLLQSPKFRRLIASLASRTTVREVAR